jgi:hypothetical protein
MLEGEDARAVAESLRARVEESPAVQRHGPALARPAAKRRQRRAG